MKRSAAILGPTPPFIAWSIRKPCRLRSEIDNLDPQIVERSLRAIRLTGEGLHRGRVVEDFVFECIENEDRFRVFRIGEVTAAYGNWSDIESTCRSCPANVEIQESEDVAGCYGWLTLDQAPDFDNQPTNIEDVSWLVTEPTWYGIWTQSIWDERSIRVLLNWLASFSSCQPEFIRLVQALSACAKSSLTFDVQSYPAGFSDGVTWKLLEHCSICKATMKPDEDVCATCGRSGRPHPEIKRKVRGHRPFVDLDKLLDHEEANRIDNLIRQATRRSRGM